MARYFKYNPQQYESMFVPLPLDLFAAKGQATQQGYDQLVTAKGQVEDEFRNVLALTKDIPKRTELINQYKQGFNEAVDSANGNVEQLYSNLKNLHKDFQTDMAYGHLGAIQQSYNTYQEVDKLWKEAKQAGKQDDATYYYNIKKKLEDWETAGGTMATEQPGVFTTFGADSPDVMFDRDKYQERIESNWKDNIETAIRGDVNYKHLESVGGLEFSEVYGAMRNDLLSRDDFNKYAEANFHYGIRGLTDEQVTNAYSQIAETEYARAMKIAEELKELGQEKSREYINAMRRAELAKNTFGIMNSDADIKEKKQYAALLEKDIFADETIQMSVDKIVHKETKMSDLIMSVEGMTNAGIGVEKWKLTQHEPVMAIPAGLGTGATTILDALNADRNGVSTASYELLRLAQTMGMDLSSIAEWKKDGKGGILPITINWEKAKEIYNGFQVAEDPLEYVNSFISDPDKKLKEGTVEAAVTLSTMQAASESYDEAENQMKVDEELFGNVVDAYKSDLVGDQTAVVAPSLDDFIAMSKMYPNSFAGSQGKSNAGQNGAVNYTKEMLDAYSKNGTTGFAWLDKNIKKTLTTSITNNPSKATGFMMEYTGGTYDDLSKSYEKSINPENISNFVDMAGEPIDSDFLKAFESAYTNKKVTYTTIKPNGGGAAYVKVTAYGEDGKPTSKILRTDVGNVRANIREKMAEQIINDYSALYYDKQAQDELVRTDAAAYGEFITLTPILEFDTYKTGKDNYIKTEAGTLILTKQSNGTVTLKHKNADGTFDYVNNKTTKLPQLFADPDAVKEYIGIYGIETFKTEESESFTDEVLTKRLR